MTKIEDELDELREKIAYYKRVLSDDALVREIIKEELQEIKKKFGTPRKTRLSGRRQGHRRGGPHRRREHGGHGDQAPAT